MARPCDVAANARQHSPHAATAPNIASADTAIQIAAGPSTRNGAAARRVLGSEAPQRDQHRDGSGRGDQQHHPAGRQAAAEAERDEQHEEEQRPGWMPGDVHRPVVRAAVGDPIDVLVQGRGDVGDVARGVRGTRTAYRG